MLFILSYMAQIEYRRGEYPPRRKSIFYKRCLFGSIPFIQFVPYCEGCITVFVSKYDSCPLHGYPNPSYKRNRFANGSIQKLKVKCPNKVEKRKSNSILNEMNCLWKGTLNDVDEHLKECPLRSVPCKYFKFGCVGALSPGNYEVHLKKCSKKHVELLEKAWVKEDPSALAKVEEKEGGKEGYDLSYLVDPKKGEKNICGICKKVAREAQEMDSEMDDIILYCKACVSKKAFANSRFYPNRTVQREVFQLEIRCPYYVDCAKRAG